MRNSISLIFTGIMMACAIGAIPSIASAQADPRPSAIRIILLKNCPCTWKQIKQANIVMQKRDYSCGAAALATILVYYWGDNVTEEQILIVIANILTPEELKDRIKKGLAISDIRRACVEMGYVSTIGTLSLQSLSESKVPLIVGLSHNKYDHFVVYRGMDCDWVYVADPIRGNIRIPIVDFASEWQKNAALVVAKEDQEPPTTSPLSLHFYDLQLGELNKQVIRTQPEKVFFTPLP